MGRRFDERYSAQLPVRIWGMDTAGRPFSLNTKTVDVTQSGARIGGINFPINKGDVVGVQCGNEKARFKVIWVGAVGGPREAQIGVHSAESGKYIWGVKLPARTWDIDPHPIPGANQRVPLAGSLELPKATPAVAKPEHDKHAARRVHKRVACAGPVEVKPESGAPPVQASLNDISVSGCYAETATPLPVHSRVSLVMTIEGQEVHSAGIVRTSHPGVGMGMSFTTLSLHDRDNLSMIVARLGQQAQFAKPAHIARAVAASQGVPPSEHRAPGPPALQTTAGPVGHRPVTTPYAVNPPRPAPPLPRQAGTHAAPPAKLNHGASPLAHSSLPAVEEAAGALSERIQKISQEVAQLQTALVSNAVDSRMIESFQSAMDHARQMAWAIEQWLHLQSQHRDPFEALPQLDAENVRRAVQLAKSIAVNIDATEIGTHTPGLDELLNATDELRLRLARLLKKESAKDKSLRSPLRSPEGTPLV